MSTTRIKGSDGVVIESKKYLELPKADTAQTTETKRPGMIRYNKELQAFEGTLQFTDDSIAYRRFPNLDEHGRLSTSQLPDSITSGLDYIGTYAPLSDDIDPPVTAGVYDKLPAPDATIVGDYYIIRGIYDAATTHLKANPNGTSPVTFTPTNPSGAGNWLEIKYYFGTDPVTPTAKMVNYAFARIIEDQIPATGHEGLLSLSTDLNLTAAFDTANNIGAEKGLADGDFIIGSSVKWNAQRNNRVSILAGAVVFDKTLMYSNNRILADQPSGTAQTIVDSLIQNTLQRTGDSMVNSGTGSGRFGIVYGSASSPSLTFNNNAFDAITNPGTDPSKWSDNTTGLFHPATGSIGFSASGSEKFRISPTQFIISTDSSASNTAPNIVFSNTSNTGLGINAVNNRIQFVSNGSVNISFAPSATTFYGTVTGTSTILSNTKLQSLGDLQINGNSILGDASTDTLVVNATSTFNAPATFADVQVNNLTVNGNTILGDASSDVLTVNATSTFAGNATVNGNFLVKGNTVIGDNSTDTFNVQSSSTFSNVVNNFLGIQMAPNATLTFQGATQMVLAKSSTSFDINMGSYDDVSIIDGVTVRTKFNRYGIKLPVLSPVNNSVGEDGMIAYSTDLNSTIQKVSGTWVRIGTSATNNFSTTDWVLNSGYYQIQYTIANAKMVQVYELQSDSSYNLVDVDTVNITGTTVTIKIPSTTDLRFNGRCVISQ